MDSDPTQPVRLGHPATDRRAPETQRATAATGAVRSGAVNAGASAGAPRGPGATPAGPPPDERARALAALVAHLPGSAAFVVDRELRYVLADGEALHAAGLSPADLLGRTVGEAFGPARAAAYEPLYRRALAGEPFEVEHEDHGRAYVTRGAPLRDARGGIEGALAVSTDVTERRSVEAALATQFALLRTVLASTDDLVFAKDRDGRYLVANDATARLMGRGSASEVVGRTDAELFAPALAAELQAHDRAVMADGQARRFEESTTVDGPAGPARVTYQSTKAPLRDASGAVLGVVGVSTDITARVAAQEALAASEAFARSVLEASPDCVKTLALDGRLLTMNAAGCALMQVDDFALIAGADWPAFWAAGGVEAEARAAVAAAARGETARFQGFCPTARDEPRWWDVLVAPVRDGRGVIARLLSVSRDVTAQHHAGAERERLFAAAERARQEAEAANAAKGQFLAVMSHELRTPLNAIGGYVQLLDMGLYGPVAPEQREVLGRVRRAQTQLLGLVTDVLNYAKLEAGRVDYVVRAVDVRDVVADVRPLVEPQLAVKGLALEVRLPEGSGPGAPCVVWADREKLAQVLANLLANAAKFTDARHAATGAAGRVTVDLAAQPGAGQPGADRVFLRVTDTGRGIPRDQMAAIFEPFVQVDASLTRTGEGTGLGLAISRDLARGMGGDLTAESREGEGSTFTVALRRVVDAAGQPTERRLARERRARERRIARPRRRRGAGGGAERDADRADGADPPPAGRRPPLT